MPSTCLICKRTSGNQSNISLHRFPPVSQPVKRKQWLTALNLSDDDVAEHHRICSLHFPNGDISQTPSLHLGKQFRSPKKVWSERAQRAAKRSKNVTIPLPKRSQMCDLRPTLTHVPSELSEPTGEEDSGPSTRMSTPIGEALLSDFSVYELPSECSEESALETSGLSGEYGSTNVVVHTALVARIKVLEEENQVLHQQTSSQCKPFRLSCIAHSDSLVHFYTGFYSYELLISFFDFLGPVVHELRYWGSKGKAIRKRKTKLDPLNQFFLTLIKLRLDARERDIAFRFQIAVSTVSKYFITWVSFLYHHLSELPWTPTVEQVRGTLPQAFKEKFPDTYSIIDATEVFIETPCDLMVQSSTWSNYKHQNTAKFIVGCTPNGAVSFVSPLYVGSITDVELTRVSGYLESLQGKEGVSVMADRGFTINDQLSPLGISLNIPPFMGGQSQLQSDKVRSGRQIASLRIHIERVIGRIKSFAILKGALPLSMSRISNQIVSVCTWLVNFQPVLIPPPSEDLESDTYFTTFSSNESDYDADTECSDHESVCET